MGEHPAVRNSLIPVLAAVVLFAGGLLLIRPNVDRGQGGPEVNAGILRLPKRDPLRTASIELAGSTTASLEMGTRDDGLWRVVVVAGGDREPTTRAAMLALGEALYAADMIAIMDPVLGASEPTPPLPIPADRCIKVSTRAASIGASPTDEWRATIVFELSEPRLPEDHPGAGLQPPPAGQTARVVVEHAGRPAADIQAGWPGRWAATGRSIVQAMLGSLLPPSGLHRPAGMPPADWGSPVPFPPTTAELRWTGCFQHDLVRGWAGRIEGRTVTNTTGEIEAAAAPLTRLLKRGDWKPFDSSGNWQMWSRQRDGHLQWFAMRTETDGWSLSMWTERPDIGGLVGGWLTQAKSGDVNASEHLRLALASPALPPAIREQIEQAQR
jgi:hypothetical protein